ncbi:MAG TPA: DUF4321 domain-containing protein [Symbiobacteriaceae bacterium]|nr:DUF4321 domain-containing protein [Symbiobacteriaceae bacterium]
MRRGWLVLLWAIIGAVVGQLIGVALADKVAILNQSINLGFAPVVLDLAFMTITLGLMIRLSIAGAIGLVFALWLALRS